jgi:hypothetical protein
MIWVSCALCACKRKAHDWDVLLPGGFKLTYYESAPDDAFFVVDAKDKAVIAPQVVKLAHNHRYIWGIADPLGDKAFDPIPKGIFVIDAVNGKLLVGLDEESLKSDHPLLPSNQMAWASSFWKPRPGIYQPHQRTKP